jgi:hypothetical protein
VLRRRRLCYLYTPWDGKHWHQRNPALYYVRDNQQAPSVLEFWIPHVATDKRIVLYWDKASTFDAINKYGGCRERLDESSGAVADYVGDILWGVYWVNTPHQECPVQLHLCDSVRLLMHKRFMRYVMTLCELFSGRSGQR